MAMQDEHSVSENGASIASKAGRKVREIADSMGVGSDYDRIASQVEQRAQSAYSTMKTTVQDKPAMAVGIAAATGLLIGMLMARR